MFYVRGPVFLALAILILIIILILIPRPFRLSSLVPFPIHSIFLVSKSPHLRVSDVSLLLLKTR